MTAGNDMNLIEGALKKYLGETGAPEELNRAMEYSLLAGGKRLRPRLCLAACEMLGGDCQAALPVACALEMIHTYSLIHDDLPCMDDDDMRRGRPSSHKVFGEAGAVLAGDGLLTYAFEIMLREGPKHAQRAPGYYGAAAAVAQGAGVSGMVAGQSLDLRYTAAKNGDFAALRAIHAKKTGAMITASVVSGALVAGAGAEEENSIRRFGEQYGLLFQITDDILDATGSSQKMGKTLGKDAAEGKLTYVTLLGLGRAKELAQEAAGQAEDALRPFGSRAAWLNELVEKTVIRSD